MGNLKCKHFAPLLASIGQLPFGLACRTAAAKWELLVVRAKTSVWKKKKRSNENVSNTANTRYIGLYTHTDYQQRQKSERGKLKNVKRQPQQAARPVQKKNQKEKKGKRMRKIVWARAKANNIWKILRVFAYETASRLRGKKRRRLFKGSKIHGKKRLSISFKSRC